MKTKSCTPEELQQYPSRLALTDAMKHMGWMVKKYETLEQDFPDLAWNSIMVMFDFLLSYSPKTLPSSGF